MPAADMATCFPGGDPFPPPMNYCSAGADCIVASDVVVVSEEVCLADGEDPCAQCEAVSGFDYAADPGNQVDIMDSILSLCPQATLTVSQECIPPEDAPTCLTAGAGCDEPVVYESGTRRLNADPNLSSVQIVYGTLSTGPIAVDGSMYLASSPSRALVGALHLPDVNFSGHSYVHTFLKVDEDVSLSTQGAGAFTVPHGQTHFSTLSSIVDDVNKSWIVAPTVDAEGQIYPNDTWELNYQSTWSGWHVNMHLEGWVD